MPFGPNELVELDTDLAQLRKIPGAPGYYINTAGEVFTVRRLRQFTDDDGYRRISTRRLRKAIHWLLARVFLPAPKPGQNEVRHLDGDRSNNSIANLAWGTRAENAADMATHGTVKGDRNSRAILTDSQVFSIFQLSDSNSQEDLAEMFSVSKSTIQAILTGRTWSHITGIKREVEAKS